MQPTRLGAPPSSANAIVTTEETFIMLCSYPPQQGALNPTGSLLLSFEDIVRAVNRFSSGLLWEGPTGVRAPLDALLILSQFMAANKVGGADRAVQSFVGICRGRRGGRWIGRWWPTRWV
jgi:hypothetical protein